MKSRSILLLKKNRVPHSDVYNVQSGSWFNISKDSLVEKNSMKSKESLFNSQH